MTLFGIFIPESPEMHVDALLAFSQGLKNRGLSYRVFPLDGDYRDCDVAVTFGVGKHRTFRGRAVGSIIDQHVLSLEGPADSIQVGGHIVIERGFVHRDRYYMAGWGGLNGLASFYCDGVSNDRWRKLGVELRPWRQSGRHIVLCGQVPWDASVQHTDHARWCRETATRLRRLSDRPIVFRPHPLRPDAIDMSKSPVEVSENSALVDDLVDAWAVVTFNSNAGVEATLAGVPAFVADEGAMGYPILNRDLDRIESPATPDRESWLHGLAYTQWTLGEMREGLAISHLWTQQLPIWKWLCEAKLINRSATPQQRPSSNSDTPPKVARRAA